MRFSVRHAQYESRIGLYSTTTEPPKASNRRSDVSTIAYRLATEHHDKPRPRSLADKLWDSAKKDSLAGTDLTQDGRPECGSHRGGASVTGTNLRSVEVAAVGGRGRKGKGRRKLEQQDSF